MKNYRIDERYKDLITQEDIELCKKDAWEKNPKRRRIFLDISVDDDGYIGYKLVEEPIMRIRRITGYLTGSIQTWNDAKKYELGERVKHQTVRENNPKVEKEETYDT